MARTKRARRTNTTTTGTHPARALAWDLLRVLLLALVRRL